MCGLEASVTLLESLSCTRWAAAAGRTQRLDESTLAASAKAKRREGSNRTRSLEPPSSATNGPRPNGTGPNGPKNDYFKTCWPAQPAHGYFFSKMDFTRAQLGQTNSNAKDNDQQDVSHLAFFPNSPRLIRFFVFRTFCFWSILVMFAFLVNQAQNMKMLKGKKKNACGISAQRTRLV